MDSIVNSGIKAVEFYTSLKILKNVAAVINICKKFDLIYNLHAPNDGHCPNALVELSSAINAGFIVFHDIYWEDEWEEIINCFGNSKSILCVENVSTVLEPLKFMRRYGIKDV